MLIYHTDALARVGQAYPTRILYFFCFLSFHILDCSTTLVLILLTGTPRPSCYQRGCYQPW